MMHNYDVTTMMQGTHIIPFYHGPRSACVVTPLRVCLFVLAYLFSLWGVDDVYFILYCFFHPTRYSNLVLTTLGSFLWNPFFTYCSASVPLTLILVASNTFTFFCAALEHTETCFSMRSALKLRPQTWHCSCPGPGGLRISDVAPRLLSRAAGFAAGLLFWAA